MHEAGQHHSLKNIRCIASGRCRNTWMGEYVRWNQIWNNMQVGPASAKYSFLVTIHTKLGLLYSTTMTRLSTKEWFLTVHYEWQTWDMFATPVWGSYLVWCAELVLSLIDVEPAAHHMSNGKSHTDPYLRLSSGRIRQGVAEKKKRTSRNGNE